MVTKHLTTNIKNTHKIIMSCTSNNWLGKSKLESFVINLQLKTHPLNATWCMIHKYLMLSDMHVPPNQQKPMDVLKNKYDF